MAWGNGLKISISGFFSCRLWLKSVRSYAMKTISDMTGCCNQWHKFIWIIPLLCRSFIFSDGFLFPLAILFSIVTGFQASQGSPVIQRKFRKPSLLLPWAQFLEDFCASSRWATMEQRWNTEWDDYGSWRFTGIVQTFVMTLVLPTNGENLWQSIRCSRKSKLVTPITLAPVDSNAA